LLINEDSAQEEDFDPNDYFVAAQHCNDWELVSNDIEMPDGMPESFVGA
jgi:hypothetical protein